MKYILSLFIATACLLSASAQKIMKLNDSLKASSEAISIKTKGNAGMGAMFKYEFGSYKIISARAGMEKNKTYSKLFSAVEKSESKQKATLVFVSQEKDTMTIRISVNSKTTAVREFLLSFGHGTVTAGREDEATVEQWSRNFVAIISQAEDTVSWKLVYLSSSATDTKKTPGILTDNNINIEIRPVNIWDNGKSPTFYPTIGYEFFMNGVSIAAVQMSPDTFVKKLVWLKNGLDDKMKTVLAAAVAAMLNYNEI